MEEKLLSNLELNQVIAEKASENEEFKLALLNDPRAAIEKEFNVVFPEDVKVEVHVESSKVLHLIIPAASTEELTDDQLEDVAGGVAANSYLRQKLTEAALANGLEVRFPPIKLCTDNAAMIAAAGFHYWQAGRFANLHLNATPNLPLVSK